MLDERPQVARARLPRSHARAFGSDDDIRDAGWKVCHGLICVRDIEVLSRAYTHPEPNRSKCTRLTEVKDALEEERAGCSSAPDQ